MKTIFTQNNKGKLFLTSPYSSGHLNEEFMFETKSLMNWYPLDNTYDYTYYPKSDCITLIRLSGADDYSSKRKSCLQVGDTLDYIDWVCPSVAEENSRVSNIAHKLNLKTFQDEYTSSDVTRGLNQISQSIDDLTAKITLEYRHKARERDSHYPNYEMMKQESIALKQVDKRTSELYILLGELYTMYRVMRKVTEKRGFTRVL